MEILITVAYIFLIWLIHFKFKLLRFNVWSGVFYFFLYGAALLIDIIVLGQVTPYSGEAAVDGVVLQLQPKWSGYVEKIYVGANHPVKKGDPIISMNPHQWEQRLQKHNAELPRALKRYKEALQLTPSGAMSEQELIFRKADVDKLKAEIEMAKFNLKHTITYAPVNGYIPIMFLRPNMYLGLLNKNSLPFICTDKLWIVAKLKQQSVQYVKTGDPVEITLEMYPGKIITGKVDEMIWAQGNVQFSATSSMAKTTDFTPSDQFFVKISLDDKGNKLPLRYGASGKIVVYTKKAFDICVLIRRIEIRCDAFLHYIYNPFK
jgi:multidrug resistance efflux pump